MLIQLKILCSTTFDKSIEFIKNIPDEPVMTEGDATQIEQSILNICINSSHAMTIMREENEKPGGKLTISISKIKGDYSFNITHPSASEAPAAASPGWKGRSC